jgi:4-oxalocrotonate tautomerase family enzyme
MPTILVYWSEGRTPEQKAGVIDGIIDVMVERGGARPEDVVVILQDMEKGSMGRGTPASASHAEESA